MPGVPKLRRRGSRLSNLSGKPIMLNTSFHEFLVLLAKHSVKYLVVGGYALGVHGFPRYTADLDVFIAVSPENAKKMPEVFKEFGFPDLDISEHDFLQKDFVIEIGREPWKIQVLTGIDGVTFNECDKGKLFVEDRELKIPFIGFDQLLKNKAASPRAKDKIDLAELKRIKSQDHNK